MTQVYAAILLGKRYHVYTNRQEWEQTHLLLVQM